MTSIQGLTASLASAWEANTTQKKGRPKRTEPRDYLTASGLSECPRAMALDLIHPEDGEDFDAHTLERFFRGDERESAMNVRLHQVGMISSPPFRPILQQLDVTLYARDGKTVIIRGKLEGYLDFGDGLKVAYEIKSGKAVERVDTLADLLRGHWTRKYVRQFLAYLYSEVKGGRGNGLGVFILDRPGLPVFIPVDLGESAELLALAEETLTNAEHAVEARFQAREMPAFTQDQDLCRRCPHLGKSCHPPMDFGPGLTVDEDEDAAAVLEEWLDTAEAKREHERCERYLFGDKEKPGRYRGREMVLAGGRYLVEGKWQPYTSYPVPEAVKLQYKKTDEKGAWKKKVTRLSDAKD